MSWMAVGGLIGGAIGAFSTKQRSKQEKRALKHQKETAWQQYLYGKAHGDEIFGIQKSEALGQLAVQKRNLDTQVDMSVGDFNNSLLAQAFGLQDARIQTASAVGMSRAAEGASGTRGNEANETVRAYASRGLERNAELQERQNRGYLDRMITGANMSAAAIEHERSTWLPGGHRVLSKQSQDAYNLNIASLGQSDFDKRMDWATPTGLDYVTGIFGGVSSGANFGYGVWDMHRNYNANRNNPFQTIGKE